MTPLNQRDHGDESWATLSEGWPETAENAHWKYVFANKTGAIPYGTYVFMVGAPDVLRVQTKELLRKLDEAFIVFGKHFELRAEAAPAKVATHRTHQQEPRAAISRYTDEIEDDTLARLQIGAGTQGDQLAAATAISAYRAELAKPEAASVSFDRHDFAPTAEMVQAALDSFAMPPSYKAMERALRFAVFAAPAPQVPAVDVEAAQEKIEVADAVKHGPTGEEWIVARVTDQHVYPAGWPPCRADRSDCTLIQKATNEQRARMLSDLRRLPSSDERAIGDET
ncbi:hypothetical protein JN531_012560 [Flagellatimonas centrodinii]|uniref:hypothetical protein n=1 Tax=Flagellatimonas centrodinii TaxID=2806210 RepID=UPI001FF864EA|nr:hypothetical protein [Flagellatimonas centrodinii]ULQ45931.1 hypothetical protein JN531_012560 [Flagellatimonas centrodinii]